MKKTLGFAYHFYYSFWNLVLSPFKFLNFITVKLFGFKLIMEVPCTKHYIRKHKVDTLMFFLQIGRVDYKSVCYVEKDGLFIINYYDKTESKIKQCELCSNCNALRGCQRDLGNYKIISCDE